MHVAGGDGKLAELIAQLNYASVVVLKIFFRPFRLIGFRHEHIVVKRLYFKIIVPFGYAALLLLRLASAYGAIKLAGFTCGAQKYAFPEHIEKAPRYAGALVEVLKMRVRNELIKVFEARKRRCKQYYVVSRQLLVIGETPVPIGYELNVPFLQLIKH